MPGVQNPHCSAFFWWKRLLQLLQLLRIGQPLDRVHAAAVRLHREHQAAAHDVAVHAQRARAAHAVLAADVRAGEAELVAQEIDQVLARQDAARHLRAVDRERDYDSVVHARSRRTPARCSLVAGEL
jgi:hypothetical protein